MRCPPAHCPRPRAPAPSPGCHLYVLPTPAVPVVAHPLHPLSSPLSSLHSAENLRRSLRFTVSGIFSSLFVSALFSALFASQCPASNLRNRCWPCRSEASQGWCGHSIALPLPFHTALSRPFHSQSAALSPPFHCHSAAHSPCPFTVSFHCPLTALSRECIPLPFHLALSRPIRCHSAVLPMPFHCH